MDELRMNSGLPTSQAGPQGTSQGMTSPGGRPPQVVQVVPSARAFCALRSDGSVASWGDALWGGQAPLPLPPVQRVVATSCAFAVVVEGDIVTWGDPKRGRLGADGGVDGGLDGSVRWSWQHIMNQFSNRRSRAKYGNTGWR